jgi:hypothetical protein
MDVLADAAERGIAFLASPIRRFSSVALSRRIPQRSGDRRLNVSGTSCPDRRPRR